MKVETRWGKRVVVKEIELCCPMCHLPLDDGDGFHFDPTDPSRIVCRRVVGKKGAYRSCRGVLESPTFALMHAMAHQSGVLTKVNELKKVLCIHEVT